MTRLGTARNGRYTDQQAVRAVQEIGTNAIPFLLEWLTIADETSVQRFIFQFAPRSLRPSPNPRGEKARRADSVPEAFHILASDAPAGQILQTPEETLSANLAARSLAAIGPVGLPALLKAITNSNRDIRLRVVMALAFARTNETLAVTVLIKAVGDPDECVKLFAWNSLGDLTPTTNLFSIFKELLESPDATIRRDAVMRIHGFPFDRAATLQVLTQALKDPAPQVRRQATNALLIFFRE